MIIRTYKELCRLDTFEERFQYLKLNGRIGESTFGFDRYLNQLFYTSERWRSRRDEIIIRDNGCDLGLEGYDINFDNGLYKSKRKIIVHHMNPMTVKDITRDEEYLLDPEFLICVSQETHNAIHYGDERKLVLKPIERTRNDTCPWRR